MANVGGLFEQDVYNLVEGYVNKTRNDRGLIQYKCFKHKSYYSRERESNIITDISIEEYINDILFIIIVIECKAYKGRIPVDDVEEFHAKLQQIGADNTKGIMITRDGAFQSGALKYAKSNGISLLKYDEALLNNYREID